MYFPIFEKSPVRWQWRVVFWIIALMILYVVTYTHLSRRGMDEAKAGGYPFFFYCPNSDVVAGQELPVQHCLCLWLFSPINLIDRCCFGGSEPCTCVLRGLRK
jgi:hypothetical protein